MSPPLHPPSSSMKASTKGTAASAAMASHQTSGVRNNISHAHSSANNYSAMPAKPDYPETFVDYIVELSDGFNSDIKELVESGSNLFSSSLKLLFPYKNGSGRNDGDKQLADVEVTSSSSAAENMNPNTKSNVSSKMLVSSSSEIRYVSAMHT
jgi:hypothetical protein